jgi:hypothetical protein
MTPVIIGGIVVVLILLAVVAAYFMGFFGGEKVPASSSNDSALLEAMIDDSPKNSPTSTPAASTRAASTPAASTPAASTPVSSTRAATTPVSSTPVSSTPVSSTRAASTRAASTPAASTRAASTPAATTPAATVEVDEVVEQTETPVLRCEEGQVESNGECIPLISSYRFDTKLSTNIRGAKSTIRTIGHNEKSLQEAKDICMKDARCDHLVSNKSREVYYLIEGQGDIIPGGWIFDLYSKVPNADKPVYTKHEGYNFTPGADFGAATYGMTVDECKQVCTDREGCDGFTIGSLGLLQSSACWYKQKPTDGSSGLLAANNSVTTYMK